MIKFDVSGSAIIITLQPPSPDAVALVKLIPGRRYNEARRVWTASATAATAAAILRIVPEEKREFATAFVNLAKSADALISSQGNKTADNLPQPPIRKTDMWVRQLRAYAFAFPLNAALLDMKMGTGKSKVVVDLIINRGHKRVLIAGPKAVITGDVVLKAGQSIDSLAVWAREFYKHAGHTNWLVWNDSRGTCAVRGARMIEFLRRCEALGKVAIVLINYEAAWRPGMAEVIMKSGFDCVVCDESHKIKSPQGAASKFLAHVGDVAKNRLCLTGTPEPHSPLDVFAQYRFLDRGIFGTSFTLFRSRYAVMGGFQGHEVRGYQNLEELRAKVDLLAYHADFDPGDLPQAIHTYRLIELGTKTRAAYQQMDQHLIVLLTDALHSANVSQAEVESFLRFGGARVVARNILGKLLRMQQITSGYLPTVDEETGIEKVVQIGSEKMDALSDVLDDLEAREPVVVFAKFRHDLDRIRESVESSGRTYSELSGRVNQLKQWQDGETDVIGVQIQAGGVGIDLTRACYCVYYSIGYSLGDYLQSLARTHRPGQTRDVVYIHLIADQTIDQKIYDALQHRKDLIEEIFYSELGITPPPRGWRSRVTMLTRVATKPRVILPQTIRGKLKKTA